MGSMLYAIQWSRLPEMRVFKIQVSSSDNYISEGTLSLAMSDPIVRPSPLLA